jgi:YD repeat-containing protein
MTSITDARGVTHHQNTYDLSGHVIKQVAADGGVTTFSHTPLNPVESTSIGVSVAHTMQREKLKSPRVTQRDRWGTRKSKIKGRATRPVGAGCPVADEGYDEQNALAAP